MKRIRRAESTVEGFGSYATRVIRAHIELAALYCRVFRYPDERVREVEHMINEERRYGHIYLVRLVKERLVGFVSYRLDVPEGDILAELFHIGCLITPSAPDGGKELIEAMGRHLGAKHGSRPHCVYLRTHTTSTSARKLYERCGFWPVAMLPSHFHSGVDEIVYQKFYNADPVEQERLEQYSRHFQACMVVFDNRFMSK